MTTTDSQIVTIASPPVSETDSRSAGFALADTPQQDSFVEPQAHAVHSVPKRVKTLVQLSREQILKATADCLRDDGYDATTIRRIASALGCAVGSIYRYFKDKRQLLDAATQQRLKPVVHLIEAGADFEHTAAEYHRHAVRNIHEYRLMFWLSCVDWQPQEAESTPPLPAVVQRIIEGWATRLRSEDSARQVWAIMHGLIALGQDARQCLAAIGPFIEQADSLTHPSSGEPDDYDDICML